MFLSEEAEDLDDWILSYMTEAESHAKELIGYIDELISRKQNV